MPVNSVFAGDRNTCIQVGRGQNFSKKVRGNLVVRSTPIRPPQESTEADADGAATAMTAKAQIAKAAARNRGR